MENGSTDSVVIRVCVRCQLVLKKLRHSETPLKFKTGANVDKNIAFGVESLLD